MLIEIDTLITEDLPSYQWLDRILHKVSDGWHIWDTTNAMDVSDFGDTEWIGERVWVKELLQKSIERDTWNSELHQRRIRVTSDPKNENEMRPEAAAKFAETPLYILVENRFSDGVFLKRIVKELHKDLLNYWMESVDAIKIDSVGGIGQMDRMVEEYAMGKSLRPRMVVIADSDKKSSNAIVRKTVKRLRETCEKYSNSH